MMEWVPHWVLGLYNFWFYSTWSYLLYWSPLFVCLVGTAMDIVYHVNRDFQTRAGKVNLDNHYRPTVTIGYMLWLFVVAFLPVVNIGYALFDHLKGILTKFYNICHDVLTTPVVPDTEVHRQTRKELLKNK